MNAQELSDKIWNQVQKQMQFRGIVTPEAGVNFREWLQSLLDSALGEAGGFLYDQWTKEARAAAFEESAKYLHGLGEEIYPRDVFQDKFGTHCRHLLEDVLPDKLRAKAMEVGEGGA